MKASCGISTLPTWRMRFLPFFCFSSSFRLRDNITTVTFCQYVFTHGFYGFAGNNFGANGCLNGNFKHLPRQQLAQLFTQSFSPFVGFVAVHDGREGIHFLAIQHDIQLHHVGFPKANQFIVEGSITAGNGFKLIEKVEYDFRQAAAQKSALPGRRSGTSGF